jgi:hypothetical protein
VNLVGTVQVVGRPVAQPLTVMKGESFSRVVTVVDYDNDGELQDLTGATIELQVKALAGAADPAIISLSVGSGITILTQSGDTLGQFRFDLSSAATAAKTPGKYRYDVAVVIGGVRHYAVPPSDFRLVAVVNGA